MPSPSACQCLGCAVGHGFSMEVAPTVTHGPTVSTVPSPSQFSSTAASNPTRWEEICCAKGYPTGTLWKEHGQSQKQRFPFTGAAPWVKHECPTQVGEELSAVQRQLRSPVLNVREQAKPIKHSSPLTARFVIYVFPPKAATKSLLAL